MDLYAIMLSITLSRQPYDADRSLYRASGSLLQDAIERPVEVLESGTFTLPEQFCNLAHPDLAKYKLVASEEICVPRGEPVVRFVYATTDPTNDLAWYSLLLTGGQVWGIGYARRDGTKGTYIDTKNEGFDKRIGSIDLRFEDQPAWVQDETVPPNTVQCGPTPTTFK